MPIPTDLAASDLWTLGDGGLLDLLDDADPGPRPAEDERRRTRATPGAVASELAARTLRPDPYAEPDDADEDDPRALRRRVEALEATVAALARALGHLADAGDDAARRRAWRALARLDRED